MNRNFLIRTLGSLLPLWLVAGCHLVMPISEGKESEAVCGDGVINPGETCDGTELGTNTCLTAGFTGGILACAGDCTLDTSGCTSGACGNGILDDGEACDPGPQAVAGCDAQCREVEGWSCAGEPSVCAPVCGDGLVVGDEVCDGDDVGQDTCESTGNGQGTLLCDAQCHLDFSGCRSFAGLTCGANHCCLVQSSGAVMCWGGNDFGQLGDGSITDRRRPVPLPGLSSVASVNAADGATCAVSDMNVAGDFLVYCWGSNAAGALGVDDAGITVSRTPVVLPWSESLTGAEPRILAGMGRHQCVLLQDGMAACWGLNGDGQVGDGQPGTDAFAPQELMGAFAGISGGVDHSCAVLSTPTATSSLVCWGANGNGQLGDGSGVSQPAPVEVEGFFGSVSCGGGFTCATTTAGQVRCWGMNNYGQLGIGSTTAAPLPVDVTLPAAAVGVTAGLEHACALLETGEVACWGRNRYGQLGDGTTTNRTSPVLVQSLSGVSHLATGHAHTCAHTGDEAVYCWGWNNEGQLGVDNNRPSINTPTPVVF